MVMRVIGRWVGREGTGRAMLKTLIDRQNHELAGAAQFTLHQNAREIGLGARIIAFIVREDFFNALRNPHFDLQIVPCST